MRAGIAPWRMRFVRGVDHGHRADERAADPIRAIVRPGRLAARRFVNESTSPRVQIPPLIVRASGPRP